LFGQKHSPHLAKWPEWNSTLDESQMEAVKQGLTKRLAIIQGPPGTGKTYVGLTIARILLSNIQCGPILVICYTNHALDQFLESIYSVENNIVRLGGRSTNEIMLKRSLNALKRGVSISGHFV
jgi:superfamily II DNA or RNA helicase